ncbi:NlpC/P60 family protein [Nocardioides humilatus]|uniref:NlpC/P60 family protein n=1 Tax=Nocardioides humilatus TaxID=2607660 RepID=A0A5B1LFY1_9ACTN|nr:C40 family peptidase [Nocardioides humilatus]KAA1419582.1 NlpC/P60 family protein [Nocardioides humilatus]
MRRPVIGIALVALVAVTAPASADNAHHTPTRSEVREAERKADAAADDVDGIQAQIDRANASLEAASIAAQQAAEAYNGAVWRLQQARKAERVATRASRRADRSLAVVKHDYRDAILESFVTGSPDLNEFSALLDADGLSSALDRVATSEIVQREFVEKRSAYESAAGKAEEAEEAAEDATDEAADAKADAGEAKDDAEAAVAAAQSAATTVADEKALLLQKLARLEGISVDLAQQRQAALEQQRQEEIAEQAQQQAAEEQAALEQAQQEAAEEQAQQEQEQEQEEQEDPPADSGDSDDSDTPDDTTTDDPSDEPDTEEPPATPPPAGGAAAAVAFARAQIGEPYVWAADGPDSWDCSGLTMGAWAAAGKSLPHYSVAQYAQSTPISSGSLQPGDLVFWGSSSDPSSIYHVALYAGNNMIIHAPRTGRDVSEESMYYWIPPNFFARP